MNLGTLSLPNVKRRILRFQSVARRAPSALKCYLDLRHVDDPLGVCFSHSIKPWQIRSELEQLCAELKRLEPRNALEIGTCSGGTLFLLCQLAAPDATIVSIDLPGGEFGGGYPAFQSLLFRRFTKPAQTLRLLRQDSHSAETLETVRNLVGELDYLFIDGDHSYQGAMLDFEMYSPLVRTGGLIAFHDIAPHWENSGCDVDRVWNEVKQRYPHREIIENPNQQWAGIGILYV